MSDDTKKIETCAFDHLFLKAAPDVPPVQSLRKKRRRKGAQHDSSWPDWKKDACEPSS